MIMARSWKDFDNLVGPMIVSFALMVALVLNFVFKYKEVTRKLHTSTPDHSTVGLDQDWRESKISYFES